MDFKTLKNLTYVSQVAFVMLTPILIGVYAGNFLDEKLGTSPWLLLLFVVIGIGSAFTSLFKMFNFTAEKKEKDVPYVPKTRREEDKNE
jgi:F0F1-type ATP synthase assembly protein I